MWSLSRHAPAALLRRQLSRSSVTTLTYCCTEGSSAPGRWMKLEAEVISNQLSPVMARQIAGTTPRLSQCSALLPQGLATAIPANGAETVARRMRASLALPLASPLELHRLARHQPAHAVADHRHLAVAQAARRARSSAVMSSPEAFTRLSPGS